MAGTADAAFRLLADHLREEALWQIEQAERFARLWGRLQTPKLDESARVRRMMGWDD